MGKKLYTVNLDEEIHDAGVELAKQDSRSFSSFLEHLLVMAKEEKAVQKHN